MFPYNILFITEYKLTFLVINIEKAVTQSQIKKKKRHKHAFVVQSTFVSPHI